MRLGCLGFGRSSPKRNYPEAYGSTSPRRRDDVAAAGKGMALSWAHTVDDINLALYTHRV